MVAVNLGQPVIFTCLDDLFVASQADYQAGIRASIRGLFKGHFDEAGFYDSMSSSIRRGLTRAWISGAGEMGIQFDELNQDEMAALQAAIMYEHQWIWGFAEAIVLQRESKGKITPLFSRAMPWIGRYEGVRSLARVMAGRDQKLKWERGATKKACTSCLRLNGKVKRASFWMNSGILPRVHGAFYLLCRGFGCLCQLLLTDEPVSRGPLPRLP